MFEKCLKIQFSGPRILAKNEKFPRKKVPQFSNHSGVRSRNRNIWISTKGKFVFDWKKQYGAKSQNITPKLPIWRFFNGPKKKLYRKLISKLVSLGKTIFLVLLYLRSKLFRF